MDSELISIIVPVYNVEQYLERCVKSLLEQTYQNLEIIMVDDGSKDSAGIIADKLKQLDDRIKVFHKENGGLSDARNYGLQYATGKYISFVDSDDFVDSEFIKTLYDTMIETQTVISAVGYQMFSEMHELQIDNKEYALEVFEGEQAIEHLFSNEKYANFACNKLYLKTLFSDVKYPVGKKMEDLGTTYILIEKCKKISFAPQKLYYYFQRPDSILHSPDDQFWVDKYSLYYERYKYIKNKYPYMEINYLSYFIEALYAYPYLYSQDREILVNEISTIWKRVKKQCDLKTKLKYNLLKCVPAFYTWLVRK